MADLNRAVQGSYDDTNQALRVVAGFPVVNPTFTGTLTAADITASGNVKIITAGKTLFVKEGANAKMGVATLVAGTLTISTTAITATSRVFLSVQTAGGTQGHLSVANRVAATSFDILSSSNTETSTVAWLLVEPA